MRYRVHSTIIASKRWYPTKGEAIEAFECQCKLAGISLPGWYPPSVSGDCFTTNDVAYPRSTCAMGRRDGHGCVYVDARND